MINDFIEYWAATRLLLSGGNPYSPAELLATQQPLGWSQPEPLMMWNPPWTLSFTLPFGFVDYQTAQFAWFLAHTLILFVGAQVLWRIYGGSLRRSRYPVVAVVSFAPTYFALLLGQIGPLILLGLIGFIVSMKNKTWSVAGASLAIAAVKPHLLYLLWLALLLWTIKYKSWKLAAGFILTGIIAALLPLFWDREVYIQYFALFESGGVTRPLDWATPSLGTAIGELFAIADAWMRWLPSMGGAMWLFWYWARHAEAWDWRFELPLILLVSVVTASFVWTFDHVVLLPAVIQGSVWTSQRGTGTERATLVGAHIGLAVILLVCKIFVRNDFWYFWAAPAYLLLYLYARATVGAAINGAQAGRIAE
jgi:glycosyl transferase family 87